MTWFGIFRLGLVQACLGAIVVLTTSTLNRVMVVELGLAAMVPGALVALHYAVQMARPRMGFGSDVGRRRTPWIAGGMAVLALGGAGAALATAWMSSHPLAGMALAAFCFFLVGLGVSACGTSLLVLLATQVQEDRRAAAATAVWVMMIVGFAVTAGLAGRFLDPYTPARLVMVCATVSSLAFCVAMLALAGLERPGQRSAPADGKPAFRLALAQVWEEPDARRFTIFVFVSMLAYSAQDLILEPFRRHAASGLFTRPLESTQLVGRAACGVHAGGHVDGGDGRPPLCCGISFRQPAQPGSPRGCLRCRRWPSAAWPLSGLVGPATGRCAADGVRAGHGQRGFFDCGHRRR
jgi:BCD family chlorophyll transporter-like MFS transporter